MNLDDEARPDPGGVNEARSDPGGVCDFWATGPKFL